jgi:hypothetical protein
VCAVNNAAVMRPQVATAHLGRQPFAMAEESTTSELIRNIETAKVSTVGSHFFVFMSALIPAFD